MNPRDFIKSVKVIDSNIIGLDYRVHKGVKLPKGKTDNRFRPSTGITSSTSALKSIEKNKFQKAYEYYLSIMESIENKKVVLFEDIAEDALKEAEVNRTKTDGTRDYLNILENDVLPFCGKMPLSDFKIRTIKAFQVYLGNQHLSQSRANTKWYVMKRVLDYAVENEYIPSNPLNSVPRTSKLFSKASSKAKKIEYFSKDEMRMILDDTCEGCNEKEYEKYKFMKAYLYVAFFIGARTGEIASLTWENVDFEKQSITISTSIRKGVLGSTKTGRTRTIPMVKELAEALLLFKGNSSHKYVFRKPHTDDLYRDSRSIVDTYYKPMLKRLELPYRILYSTRHTFASIAMENGVALSTISKCLGHQSTEITSRYYIKHSRSNEDLIRTQLESLSA